MEKTNKQRYGTTIELFHSLIGTNTELVLMFYVNQLLLVVLKLIAHLTYIYVLNNGIITINVGKVSSNIRSETVKILFWYNLTEPNINFITRVQRIFYRCEFL